MTIIILLLKTHSTATSTQTTLKQACCENACITHYHWLCWQGGLTSGTARASCSRETAKPGAGHESVWTLPSPTVPQEQIMGVWQPLTWQAVDQDQDPSKCSILKQKETRPETGLGRSCELALKSNHVGTPTIWLRQGLTAEMGLITCKCTAEQRGASSSLYYNS